MTEDNQHPARLFGRPCIVNGQKGWCHGFGPGTWAGNELPLMAYIEWDWNGRIEPYLVHMVSFCDDHGGLKHPKAS